MLSTGFAFAAFQLWNVTVAIVMSNTINNATQ